MFGDADDVYGWDRDGDIGVTAGTWLIHLVARIRPWRMHHTG
jgi:hypothetical protein